MILPRERHGTDEHLKQYRPHAPQIRLGVVSLIIQNFGRHVQRTPAHGVRHPFAVANVSREPKISDFQLGVQIVRSQQQILRFQISMHDLRLAHRLEPPRELKHETSRRDFFHPSVPLDELTQIPPPTIFQHDVHRLVRALHIDKPENIFVSHPSHHLHLEFQTLPQLFTQPLARDLLHRHHRPRLHARRSPHRRERPSTERRVVQRPPLAHRSPSSARPARARRPPLSRRVRHPARPIRRPRHPARVTFSFSFASRDFPRFVDAFESRRRATFAFERHRPRVVVFGWFFDASLASVARVVRRVDRRRRALGSRRRASASPRDALSRRRASTRGVASFGPSLGDDPRVAKTASTRGRLARAATTAATRAPHRATAARSRSRSRWRRGAPRPRARRRFAVDADARRAR